MLSGFLIASQLFRAPLAGRSTSLFDFYFRRGLRIWPNYLVVLALYFAFPVVLERGTLPPLWKFLTFTQNFGLDYRTEGAFSHAWSLCVEEHFYLVLPVVVPLLVRLKRTRTALAFVASILLGGMILRGLLWSHFVGRLGAGSDQASAVFYREIYYPTYCRLDGLTVGVGIAALFRFRPVTWAKLFPYANFFLAGGLALLGLAFAIGIDDHGWAAAVFEFPLVALGFGALVMSALSSSGLFARIRIPGIEGPATLAFSFYLVHKSVIHLSQGWLVAHGYATASISYLAAITGACIVAALALYFAIERPSLAWRDRHCRT